MILTKLNIKKFRGLSNISLDFQTGLNAVCGKNGIGKTTVVDTVLWLLADETLVYGGTNADNLDKNAPKDEIEVEGVFTKDDGTELTFKRLYKAKYTKDGEFSDYTNELYINNAKYTVKDYTIRIYQELGLNTDFIIKGFNDIRALMDFDYFGSIDYKKAREKLEKILNISSDEELVSSERYAPIRNDLKALLYDVSKAKTMYNKDVKGYETELAKKEAVLEEKEKASKNVVDTNKIKELENNLAEIEAQNFEFSEDYNNAKKELEQAYTDSQNNASRFETYKHDILVLKQQNENLINQAKKLKFDFDATKEQAIAIRGSVMKCPNCQYELNGDEVKKKLVDLTGKLNEIKKKNEELLKNETLTKFKEVMANYDKQTKEFVEVGEHLDNKIKTLTNQLYVEDEKYKQFEILKAQKTASIKAELQVLYAQSNTEDLTPYKDEIKKLKDNLAKTELKLELLDEYKEKKIRFIQEKASTIFPNIEFVLVEVSNSGAVSQTCKATYKGVDYLGLNDAQRIIIGIQIIEDIRKAFGVKETLPIIVNKLGDLDNTNKKGIINYTTCQILATYSSNDEQIKIINI